MLFLFKSDDGSEIHIDSKCNIHPVLSLLLDLKSLISVMLMFGLFFDL